MAKNGTYEPMDKRWLLCMWFLMVVAVIALTLTEGLSMGIIIWSLLFGLAEMQRVHRGAVARRTRALIKQWIDDMVVLEQRALAEEFGDRPLADPEHTHIPAGGGMRSLCGRLVAGLTLGSARSVTCPECADIHWQRTGERFLVDAS